MMVFDVLIVGGGHGGAQAAIALRQRQFRGSIAILGDDPELPYERPPLSKDYLSGQKGFDRILIRPAGFWTEREITLLSGRRAAAVDAASRTVTTEDGQTFGYERLVWATGGQARKLSCTGQNLAGVHSVRARADVDKIIGELAGTERVVIIGGGYIGLEAAAVLAKMGKRVVVLEAMDRVLARVAGEPLSRFYEAEHRTHGVEVRLNVGVVCIEGSGGRACGVRLADGEVVAADMVIVGIGIVPSVEPLLAAGAAGGNGVSVDAHGRTTLADVFAIGDCALHANAYADGLPIRLESVQNATELANTVASTLTGSLVAHTTVPWFWSNQYDLRLQTVGLSIGHDTTVVRGDPARRSFSVIYLRRGRVIALDCVNATRDYVQGKRVVVEGLSPSIKQLSDSTIALKDL